MPTAQMKRHQEDHDHQDCQRASDGLAQLIQAALQRRFFRFNGLQHGGDQAELGVHAGAE